MRARTVRGFLFTALLAAAATLAGAAEPNAFPDAARRGIEKALKSRVSSLLGEKDASGARFKRGTYSKHFQKIDDSTCQVVFHRDTADKESLLTERLLLTLKESDDGRNWEIVSEEVQDEQRAAFRTVPEDETFKRFESFRFDREGFKVTAGGGVLYEDYRLGKPDRLLVHASDIQFQYAHPVDDKNRLVEILAKENDKEYDFDPEFISLSCDPVSCEDLISSSFTGLAEASRQDAPKPLEQEYDEFLKNVREAREEDPFSGFSLPWEPDQRYYRVAVWREDPDRQAGLSFHNRRPEEVRFFASGVGLWSYYSEGTRQSTIVPEELERRLDEGARDYEVESVVGTVELGVGDAEMLVGDLDLTLRARRDLDKIFFDLAGMSEWKSSTKEARNPRMTLNSIRDAKGRELTFVKTGPVSGLVILADTVPAGASFPLKVQYENSDCIYKLTPAYSYVDRDGWLPFVRFGDMIDTFDLTLKVPSKFTPIGVGTKSDDRREDRVRVTRWVAPSPVVFPTVIYGIYHEDKPSFKATKKNGDAIQVDVHVDKDFGGGLALKSLRAAANEAANSLNLYREIFGVDYPYDKLDLVNAPQGFSGQSPSSIVYLGTETFLSKGILGSFIGGDLTRFTRALVAHEVAHQWWGSLIAPANFRNYWWVESLSEYASALFLENAYGKDSYQDQIADWRRGVLESTSFHTVQEGSGIYTRGAYAFHILRSTFGDEAFFKFLKMLAMELQGKEIVTHDLQHIAERAFQMKLDWFFDEWIRGVGLPEFTFEYHVTPAPSGKHLLEGRIDQKVLVNVNATKRVPLEGRFFQGIGAVSITTKGGKVYRKRVVLDGPSASFKVELPDKPKEVVFNKYGELLAFDVVREEAR